MGYPTSPSPAWRISPCGGAIQAEQEALRSIVRADHWRSKRRGQGHSGEVRKLWLRALYFLNKKYRPNTHARKIQCLTEVVRPQIIKDSRQMVAAVEMWEGKVGSLLRDFDRDLGDGIKTAILISMTPRQYQDMVFQLGMGQASVDYKEVRDKIVRNRAQMPTPTPMDV